MSERIALVTGATSGIGRQFAVELAGRGWRVVCAARDEGRLARLLEQFPGAGHEILAVDLATDHGVDVVTSRLSIEPDAVSLLVNAAGSGTTAPYPLAPLAEEITMLRLNVEAVLRLSHAAAHAMTQRGHGGIINVSSTAAYWSAGTYAASKAWVLAATLGLRAQVAGQGLRVMAVAPGFTKTEFHARSATDASGVRPWLWLEADQVVEEALAALAADRAVCIPGRRYRALVETVRHLPPGGRRAVLGRLAPLRGARP